MKKKLQKTNLKLKYNLEERLDKSLKLNETTKLFDSICKKNKLERAVLIGTRSIPENKKEHYVLIACHVKDKPKTEDILMKVISELITSTGGLNEKGLKNVNQLVNALKLKIETENLLNNVKKLSKSLTSKKSVTEQIDENKKKLSPANKKKLKEIIEKKQAFIKKKNWEEAAKMRDEERRICNVK